MVITEDNSKLEKHIFGQIRFRADSSFRLTDNLNWSDLFAGTVRGFGGYYRASENLGMGKGEEI